MAHPSGDRGYIGQSVRRREDLRLLRGQGLFVADVRVPGMAHAAVLRSPLAHARVTRVDLSAARAMRGVLAAQNYADLGGMAKLPMLVPHPSLYSQSPYPLARDRVRYVGEPVAVVAAESAYLAEDALELIEVDYEPLPVVLDAEQALEPGTTLLHDDMDTNLASTIAQTVGDPDRAFAEADLVIKHNFRFGRLAGQPMETRGVVANYERTKVGGHFTIWNSTQAPHTARRVISELLRVPQHAVRVIAPDVGGGFGVKGRVYPEEILVPFLARLLDRPVRWISDRREDLLASTQAREQIHHLEVAARADGTILGVRDRYTVDLGAYSPFGVVVAINAQNTLPGPYKIRNYQAEMRAVYTNKMPMAPYRAAGRPPAVFAMEHALDLVARKLGLDPAEVRFRNFVQPDEFPYKLGLIDRDGSELTYDSGNYPECLRRVLDLIDVKRFRAEQTAAREQGRHLGLGIGCYVESTGRGPYEGATVRVEPSGQVVVESGASPQGQGHDTILAQICADRLGVDIDAITVFTGDSDAIGMGIGTFASRTAVVAGNAVSGAAGAVKQKALQVAAQMLDESPEDLAIDEGVISVRGVPDKTISLARVAQVVTAPPPAFIFPAGLEPGLEATHFYHPTANTYSNGVHAAVVEVDPETAIVRVLRYAVVHDCGTVINPMILDGQVRGGVAQGIGNALYEEIVLDEQGQPLTTSFMSYLLPTAMEVPSIAVAHLETPSPVNPEGIKGAGEGGTMPVPAVIANAIEDALAPMDIVIDHIALSPSRLWEIIASQSPGQSAI
ncbi:MAG TPA: xanthine dehydrogenase family protein molybdopterin-binding subunit [Chloroflexota bacterium]